MTENNISKPDLQAVIRRAAELYAAETESETLLSESEVLRIGDELGLPERLVRQALYELPEPEASPSWVDRFYGSPVIAANRAVAGEANANFKRLEEYLSTREYLQVRRKQGGSAWLEPADDPISAMARAFWRPARRYYLSRASRVALTVRALEPGTSHVRLGLDMSERRRTSVIGAIFAGGFAGIGTGTLTFILIAAPLGWLTGTTAPTIGLFAAAAAAIAAGGSTIAGTLSFAARRFRRRMQEALVEVEGLLDRLERGDGLEPPPAPWWRRFQGRSTNAPQLRHR
jgi:hypothetical protein